MDEAEDQKRGKKDILGRHVFTNQLIGNVKNRNRGKPGKSSVIAQWQFVFRQTANPSTATFSGPKISKSLCTRQCHGTSITQTNCCYTTESRAVQFGNW